MRGMRNFETCRCRLKWNCRQRRSRANSLMGCGASTPAPPAAEQPPAKTVDEPAKATRLRELLAEADLSSYADAIIKQGYDSIELLGAMTDAELDELVGTIGMGGAAAHLLVVVSVADDDGLVGGRVREGVVATRTGWLRFSLEALRNCFR